MLDQRRIVEAERNFPRYVQEERLFLKHPDIARYIHFFLKNAETSLLTAQALFTLSEDKQKQELLALKDFESYLWVVVSSYYAMFYAVLALLAKHDMKVGEQQAHKVVADTLIAQFLRNKRLSKLIESYEDNKDAALELVGSEEKAFGLVESYDLERRKRHQFQYDLGAEAKQNFAKTSFERASAFVAEIRNILREK